MACSNTAQPLLLPFTNVTLNNKIVRGIRLDIGTPPKAFSLRPRTSSSHVGLYNTSTCGNITAAKCESLRGNLYAGNASDTFYTSTAQDWNGSMWSNEQGLAYAFFEDVLQVGSSKPIPNFSLVLEPPSGKPSVSTRSLFGSLILTH